MTADDALRTLATGIGALSALMALVVMLVRWVVREQVEPLKDSVHRMSEDLKTAVVGLRQTVEDHDRRLTHAERALERLHADKASHVDVQLRIDAAASKIQAAAGHKGSGTTASG